MRDERKKAAIRAAMEQALASDADLATIVGRADDGTVIFAVAYAEGESAIDLVATLHAHSYLTDEGLTAAADANAN